MRGVILAGGSGFRLSPITKSVNKQLLPVYDKPMVFYPLATLLTAGVREVLLVTTEEYTHNFQSLLGDGSQFGISISYAVQNHPRGIADAFIVGEDFIGKESVALILGDNIFHGTGLGRQLQDFSNMSGANIFGYHVSNPQDYGVIEFSSSGKAISVEEKPSKPKSNFAIPGLYFFDNDVIRVAKEVKPSTRGELEITSVLEVYLQRNALTVTILPRGTAWLDTGSVNSLHDAASYVRIIEERQGSKIACLEEISWYLGLISTPQLESLGKSYGQTEYGKYILSIVNQKKNRE
jgi:glucose-1-phosphate thymidylyltransferase